ncbi:MAG: diacylglycerol kinase family protein [Chloroflexota bacterium]|nr:diacylglycerol kinase family protein [Chloroflexota bacterium]
MAQPAEKKFFIAVNLKSGRYREKPVQKYLARFLRREGVSAEIYCFVDEDDLSRKVQEAIEGGIRSFVAVGGDGSVSLVASCLEGNQFRIGIIPTGTTNMVAQLLGIPLNLKKAFNLLVSSARTVTIDGMEINGRVFLINSSVGISSSLMKSVTHERKRSLGVFAYVFAGIRSLFRARTSTFSLEVDGEARQVEAAELLIANMGAVLAPPFTVAESQPDDGRLEVCVIHKTARGGFPNALLDLLVRKKKRGILCIGRGKRIAVSCTETLSVQADGDVIGETPVTVQVVPGAATFIVP